jgi:hypothetical protein
MVDYRNKFFKVMFYTLTFPEIAFVQQKNKMIVYLKKLLSSLTTEMFNKNNFCFYFSQQDGQNEKKKQLCKSSACKFFPIWFSEIETTQFFKAGTEKNSKIYAEFELCVSKVQLSKCITSVKSLVIS